MTGLRADAFNIANGDLFRWSELWPKLAAYFGLEVAPPLRFASAAVPAGAEDVIAAAALEAATAR